MDCPVTARPTVIVISDSLGDTACEVVLAASGQFDEGAFRLLRLPKVTSVEQVKSFVGPRVDADHRDIAVFVIRLWVDIADLATDHCRNNFVLSEFGCFVRTDRSVTISIT